MQYGLAPHNLHPSVINLRGRVEVRGFHSYKQCYSFMKINAREIKTKTETFSRRISFIS